MTHNDNDIESSMADRSARNRRIRFGLSAVLVVLFVMLVGLGYFVVRLLEPPGKPEPQDTGEGMQWIRSIYGATGAIEDQFVAPTYVAIGPDGIIWVTETSANRVWAFEPDGTFVRELQVGGADGSQNMLQAPAGIAVSEANEIYVAAFGSDLVLVFSADGELLRAINVPFPQHISVNGDRLAVATTEGLSLYSVEGEKIADLAYRGSEANQVDLAQGIYLDDDGTIYVSDTHNAQIKAFTVDGELLWVNPAGAGSEGQSSDASPTVDDVMLQLPSGMTMDSSGRIVLADPFAFRIFAASAVDGSIQSEYGVEGSNDGQFFYPTDIAYDENRDWFAVTDTSNGRVQIVRIDGSGGDVLDMARSINGPYWLCGVPLVLLIVAALIALGGRRRSAGPNSDE